MVQRQEELVPYEFYRSTCHRQRTALVFLHQTTKEIAAASKNLS
ncbi:MAG: hypothetical protein ACQJCO_00565 [cyanobacterium endosymbiont of Rhopalodia sterrenbergii]